LKQKESNVGGQALIEGVMMRGKSNYTIALRKESGEIKLIHKDINSLKDKLPIFDLPFLRGIIALFENLAIGMKSLILSANEALPEEEKSQSKKAEGFTIFLMVVTSIVFGMGIFVAVPNIVVEVLGIQETVEPITFNLVAGALRMVMFVLYVFAISTLKDVKRVFQYHGAEHKVVNTFEAEQELTLENAKKQTTYHPRCGTSFMFFVFFVSIFIFSLVPVAFMAMFSWFAPLHVVFQKMILIPTHILLLPIVAGISYELIKLTFKNQDNLLMQWIAKPGYYIQKLTTQEPDDEQIEVALSALQEVVKLIETTDVDVLEGIAQPSSALASESI